MLTVDEFIETYKPIKNSITNNDTHMFETYGEELDYVRSQPDRNIWTELEGEDGVYIVSGFHYVNRLAYYICQVEFPIDKMIEVVVQLDKECDCESNPNCSECDGNGYISIYPETRQDLIEIYGEERANG